MNTYTKYKGYYFYILVLRKHRVGEWILRFDIQCQSHQSSQNLLNLAIKRIKSSTKRGFSYARSVTRFHLDVLKLDKE